MIEKFIYTQFSQKHLSTTTPVSLMRQLFQKQQKNKIQQEHMLTRSKLTSIEEQDPTHEDTSNTQLQLIKVYHGLYLINYSTIFMGSTKQHFHNISQTIDHQHPTDYSSYSPLTPTYEKEVSEVYQKYLKNNAEDSKKEGNFLTVEEFRKEAGRRGINSKQPVNISPSYEEKSTCTKASINDMMTQLTIYDNRRTQLKANLYLDSTQPSQQWQQWTNLHEDMKEVLENLVEKLGDGDDLLTMYDKFNNHEFTNHTIDNHNKQTIFGKLDHYLQSLYMDERQLNFLKVDPTVRRKLEF